MLIRIAILNIFSYERSKSAVPLFASLVPSVAHYLYHAIAIVRNVLKLAELARKLETQTEQVLPFAPPDADLREGVDPNGGHQVSNIPPTLMPVNVGDSSNVLGEGTSAALLPPPPPPQQSSVWTDNGVFVPSTERLWHFQRKYNKALLDDLAIEREKERLTLENAQLQDLIAQYLEGTQVSDSVLREDNPLFVVNGR